MSGPSEQGQSARTRKGHGGNFAVAVAQEIGVETLFTLSGAHVFPVYDGAVSADPPIRLIDVRHESTAVFAAEATGKLTRTPGLAVVTAGPGVTNSVSAIAQADAAGSPLVVLGGRAPDARWGTGSLQELDHPPLVASITRSAETVHAVTDVAAGVQRAFVAAGTSHRGPAFVDVAMDHLFASAEVELPGSYLPARTEPDGDALTSIATLLGAAQRPVLVLGTDVWADHAEDAALRLVDELGLPTITNGMGRGLLSARHPLLVSKARSVATRGCDLAIVVGTPLDFRMGYGRFGPADAPAQVVHLADSPGQLATHLDLDGAASGDLTWVLDGLREAVHRRDRRPDWRQWVEQLSGAVRSTAEKDRALLGAEADPIHPARIYGELIPRLDDDAVVIGDGGDFVSFAGKFLEPMRPGRWLDPGPFGCLGAGLGAAMAARLSHPSEPVVLLLGDGAAGFSLLDADTLVRHGLPVVMVVGNNSGWGLEKHPMRSVYGYDVATDLGKHTRYDQVVEALGGAGETVSEAAEIGPALDRALAANVPYLVNVLTDTDVAYPRNTTGI